MAEEPLTKVTLNIFTSDFEYLKRRGSWGPEIRDVIRRYITNEKRKAASLSQGLLLRKDNE